MNYDFLYKHSTNNQYYVYAYLDPRVPGRYNCITSTMLCEPFYVGKGIHNRYRLHLSLSQPKHPFYSKIKKIRAECKDDPHTVILSTFNTEEEAFAFESLLISHLRAQQIKLTNIQSGGKMSYKQYVNTLIAPRSSKFKGIPRTEDIKQKISTAKKQHHPTAKRWLVISPNGNSYTPRSLPQLLIEELGYTPYNYKALINAHRNGQTTVKRGEMTSWQIYELT